MVPEPYAQPPTGSQRWKPPVALVRAQTVDASKLGPSCLQQFPTTPAPPSVVIPIFDTSPLPSENEDCLFLNVWAPESIQGPPKAIIFWIHGGSLSYGSASIAHYDASSLAKNQDVVVVSINYRTNVFGFPFGTCPRMGHPNIHAFGGDPNRISLMGQSAGATSVTWFIQRHPVNPPFQSAIILSSVFLLESTPTTYEQAWTTFATAVGCTESVGTQLLQCLKQVPGSKIQDYFNNPTVPPMFAALIDNITVFPNPVQCILDRKVASVPVLRGCTENDGSMFAVGKTDVDAMLNNTFGPGVITPADIPWTGGFSFIRTHYIGSATIQHSPAKNPFVSPAPTWPKYNPNSTTLANLAFNGIVGLNNVVQTTSPAQLDGTCKAFWDKILLSPRSNNRTQQRMMTLSYLIVSDVIFAFSPLTTQTVPVLDNGLGNSPVPFGA
ncbi:hypothetical protein PILCRDRAFT_11943 [Piloderma croceum F 1598]|uniref:Carboxylic ester hydrolase n=1 Tax=Piloderma croceum (strain F 1598) TaxID=765440 RepID=A0A0C3EYA3_PILCF|nr:hypothetical protein PILCRDRAFT_11943 [Piloderma croceum F 1598]